MKYRLRDFMHEVRAVFSGESFDEIRQQVLDWLDLYYSKYPRVYIPGKNEPDQICVGPGSTWTFNGKQYSIPLSGPLSRPGGRTIIDRQVNRPYCLFQTGWSETGRTYLHVAYGHTQRHPLRIDAAPFRADWSLHFVPDEEEC